MHAFARWDSWRTRHFIGDRSRGLSGTAIRLWLLSEIVESRRTLDRTRSSDVFIDVNAGFGTEINGRELGLLAGNAGMFRRGSNGVVVVGSTDLRHLIDVCVDSLLVLEIHRRESKGQDYSDYRQS